MKKIFTIALLAIVAMTANAQTKRWDFRNWSATTVANLQLGANQVNPANGWSDIEKATDSAPTATSANNCFWQVSASATQPDGVLTANGAVIAETEGLYFTNTNNRSLAIAVNYPVALNDYKGPSYLWLGSKNLNYFIIPNVAPGTTIKMGVESHKNSDARGVELYVTHGLVASNSGTKLLNPDGEANPMPTVYDEYTWVVPAEGLTDEANEDGTYDIQVRNTNGCHIYFIEVGGSTPVVEGKNIAVISNGEGYVDIFQPVANEYTTIDPSTASSKEELEAYDAIIVGNVVKADDAIVPALKSVIARVPMINYSPALYAESVEMTAETVTVTDPENSLFADLSIDEDNQLASVSIMGTPNYTVTLGDYFADDRILAKDGDAVAIHQHNPNRNSYIFIFEDADGSLLNNAINVVAATKKAVTAAATPTIAVKQKDGESEVTISCATSGAKIYYTVDGTEPTSASPVYAAPFSVTTETTVKAIAEADGFDPSAVASQIVTIATQAATPAVTVAKAGEKSTVTLTGEEGTTIYYNFTGSKKQEESATYSEPIELSEPTVITAFAIGEGKLQSEAITRYVAIEAITAANIRMDEIAHCDFNETDWYTNVKDALIEGGASGSSSSAFYYWGKSAWNYYQLDADGNRINEGTEEEPIYIPNPEALKTVEPGNGWIIKSYGQASTLEYIASAGGVANGRTGRYADSIEDLVAGEPSKGLVDFGGKTSGDPYSMSIETTAKYAGPFDVVTYLGNGGTSDLGIVVETSTDGESWTELGALNYTTNQRYWKRTKLSYEGTDEVYVRVAQKTGGSKGQLYDIILLNNGENSKLYDASKEEEKYTGIANVIAKPAHILNGIYDLSGRRLQSVPSQGMYIINGKKYVK